MNAVKRRLDTRSADLPSKCISCMKGVLPSPGFTLSALSTLSLSLSYTHTHTHTQTHTTPPPLLSPSLSCLSCLLVPGLASLSVLSRASLLHLCCLSCQFTWPTTHPASSLTHTHTHTHTHLDLHLCVCLDPHSQKNTGTNKTLSVFVYLCVSAAS